MFRLAIKYSPLFISLGYETVFINRIQFNSIQFNLITKMHIATLLCTVYTYSLIAELIKFKMDPIITPFSIEQ